MALSDDDVREILRIIDESELDELRIETDGLSLHVLRGGAAPAATEEPALPAAEPEPTVPAVAPQSSEDGLTIVSPTIGVFYRAPARARRRSSRSGRASSPTRSSASSR